MDGKASLLTFVAILALALSGCSDTKDGDATSDETDPQEPRRSSLLPSELAADLPRSFGLSGCRSVDVHYQIPASLVQEPEGLQYARVDPAGLLVEQRALFVNCDEAASGDVVQQGAFLYAASYLLVTPADSPDPGAEHRYLHYASTDVEGLRLFLRSLSVESELEAGSVEATGTPAGSAALLEVETSWGLIQSAGPPSPAGQPARAIVWATGATLQERSYVHANQTAAAEAAMGYALEYAETDLQPVVMPRRPSDNAVGFGLSILAAAEAAAPAQAA